MVDFALARRMMVDGQVRPGDVTDLRILAAMLELPRERFVSQEQAPFAYLDGDLPVDAGATAGGDRRLLKPRVLAKLVQAAAVRDGDRVLEVGCATGYSSAVLAKLAGEVFALEQDPERASRARQNLRSCGIANVTVVEGPLIKGWPAAAPYDVILLNGAAETMPPDLGRQLKEGGRLVGIEGRSPAMRAMLYRSSGGKVSGWPVFDATAAVLPGFAAAPAFVF